jgi:hypothetical protein
MDSLIVFFQSINLIALGGWVLAAVALAIPFVLTVVTLFRTTAAFNSAIEDRVKIIVENPDFIRKIASLVRPTVIFNSNGSILHDLGGISWISEIKVEKSGHADWGSMLLPSTIIVTPINHMANAPIITYIDLSGFQITASRTTGFSWLYALKPCSVFISDETEVDPEILFRMEIVP